MVSAEQSKKPSGPLRGLRVLDAGTMIAGPLAGTHLADFGADVIKVELPHVGDSMRHWAPIKDGKSLWWKVIGRNKHLLTLNLAQPEGAALFKRIVAKSDIVIENYRPGTFAKWGLSYEALAAVNPRVILVHVSGFGQTGPYAQRGGYGTVAEAFSGIASFTGFPDKPPTLPGFPLADSTAATFAAMAAMFAVYERDQGGSGRGQEIDVSLYEPLFRLVESQVIGFDQLGIVKQRIGNRLAEDSPRNTYQTRDGRWVGISASSQKTYEILVNAMEMPELITDPRFLTNASRCEHADPLDARIANWFSKRDLAAILTLFESKGVVAGPVLDIRDIWKDPHYRARDNIVEVEDEDFGSVHMQGVAPRFTRTPGAVKHSGRSLGADNDTLYRDLLGLSGEELDRLRGLNII